MAMDLAIILIPLYWSGDDDKITNMTGSELKWLLFDIIITSIPILQEY